MFFGRLNRAHYTLLFASYMIFNVFVIPALLSPLSGLGFGLGLVFAIALFVTIIVTTVFCGIVARRMQDIGWSGAWAWLIMLPTVLSFIGLGQLVGLASTALLIGLALIVFIPGAKGNNRYGPPQPSTQSWRTSIFGS